VNLRIITFSPPAKSNLPSIVLVPGLAGVIDSFKDLLIELTQRYRVYYLETREKGSSRISQPVGFSVQDIASDIPVAIQALGLADGSYILIGYSLGASTSAVLLGEKKVNPKRAVLVEPSATFKWPKWLLLLARYGVPLYGAIKPFLKWYMRNFRINTDEDMEIYEINCRNLDQANPRKLGATVRAIANFSIWNYLAEISVPCLVIGASKDSFHSHDEALEISKGIMGCRYIDLVDNKRSHNQEAAKTIAEFIEEQKQ
jgi:pimeloyl-ACP methyl ester carboxylesterase